MKQNAIQTGSNWFSIFVECDPGWIRVGCSSYQDNCQEADCGVHGVVPEGERGCRAYFDSQENIWNRVYAYCLRRK